MQLQTMRDKIERENGLVKTATLRKLIVIEIMFSYYKCIYEIIKLLFNCIYSICDRHIALDREHLEKRQQLLQVSLF